MRELLYNAAKHFKRGKALSERGDSRGAMIAFEEALEDLHAVKPQRMRDVLLAQVYLSRYLLGQESDPFQADSDLRLGYSYARTTAEPTVRHMAETLWEERLTRPPLAPPRSVRQGRSGRGHDAGKGGRSGRDGQDRDADGADGQYADRSSGDRRSAGRASGERQTGDRQPGERQGGRGRGGRRGNRPQGEPRGD